eukprot:365823-Chlamydomonas_euryale.AAC.16
MPGGMQTCRPPDMRPGAQRYTQLVSNLLSLCQEYLHHPGSVRGMSALLLGRLLTRPDMRAALEDFVAWAEGALRDADGTLRGTFLTPGVLQALCFAFKLGQRARLLPHTPRVWALLTGPLARGAEGSTLSCKLGIKLLQRLALTFLVPRLAPWRYTRDDAAPDLQLTLVGGGGQRDGGGSGRDGGHTAGGGGGAADDVAAAAAAAVEAEAAGGEQAEGDEDFEIAEEVEEVVERLLGALRNRDTVVRWSAAKGVGRVTGCLPQDLADEIVEQVRNAEGVRGFMVGCGKVGGLASRGMCASLSSRGREEGCTGIGNRCMMAVGGRCWNRK